MLIVRLLGESGPTTKWLPGGPCEAPADISEHDRPARGDRRRADVTFYLVGAVERDRMADAVQTAVDEDVDTLETTRLEEGNRLRRLLRRHSRGGLGRRELPSRRRQAVRRLRGRRRRRPAGAGRRGGPAGGRLRRLGRHPRRGDGPHPRRRGRRIAMLAREGRGRRTATFGRQTIPGLVVEATTGEGRSAGGLATRGGRASGSDVATLHSGATDALTHFLFEWKRRSPYPLALC